jgi:hypothetical protein
MVELPLDCLLVVRAQEFADRIVEKDGTDSRGNRLNIAIAIPVHPVTDKREDESRRNWVPCDRLVLVYRPNERGWALTTVTMSRMAQCSQENWVRCGRRYLEPLKHWDVDNIIEIRRLFK